MSRWKSFFMVVAVLLLHHHHQTCDAITNTNNQTCPPSSCGNITDIKHPFRLMNDPASCGDPKYELSCENNITVLTLFSGKYYVKSINYSDYSIWLVDRGIEEGNCSSLPRYFLSSANLTTFQSYDDGENDADPYQIRGTSDYGHIIYLKCSKAVNDDPEYVDTAPCISSDSKSYLYAFAAEFHVRDYEYYARKNYFSVGRLKDYCQVKLVAMSSSDFPNVSVREGVPDRSLSYEEIHGMLLYGFQLSWTNKNTYCPPSSCGKIKCITHPFRLKDDPTSCGDPKYELSCENNITVLTLFSGKYYVKSINYNNYTIRLVDPGIQEGDCSSVPHYSLSSSNLTEFQSYDYNDADLYQIEFHIRYWYIIYLKCSKQVNDDAEYVDAAPCINSDSKTYLYAFAGDSYLSDHSFSAGRLKDYCQVKLVAMSSSDFPSDSVPLSYEEIHGILLYGFELSWMSGPCREHCGEKNGCKLNYTTGDLECSDDYCEYPLGISVNKRCDQLSKGFILVQDIILGIFKGALRIFGSTKSASAFSPKNLESKTAIETGRVIGRYLLPIFVPRFILGLPVFFVLLIYTCRRRHISMYEDIEVFLQGSTMMPIRYSYKEIKKMTQSFRDKLGEGGFGAVFKGKLRSGTFVAIKMLGKSKGNGEDFINEVATIGRIHHTNVVRLVGFCFEGSKRALVYEFMPNGSLDKYISSREDTISLSYQKMYEISLGVARGIAYLHQGCDMQILHFDIKPHNILLDVNFIPKVSDFGLAKLYPNEISIVTLTAARGTIGYMAPELFYKNIGGVSYKADVYSFGMLLMEMASKRRNLNPHADRSSQLFFPFWIYNQLNEKREIEMDEISDEERINVNKMFITALWCIQLKPCDRPAMNKVIEMLEGNIENIEMPPKPSFYPNEVIEEDLDVNSNETESENDAISFIDNVIYGSLY